MSLIIKYLKDKESRRLNTISKSTKSIVWRKSRFKNSTSLNYNIRLRDKLYKKIMLIRFS